MVNEAKLVYIHKPIPFVAGFTTPIFEHGGRFYIQISKNGVIESFEPVELSQRATLDKSDISLVARVGGTEYVSLLTNEFSNIIGTRDDLTAELKESARKYTNPYLLLEIAKFIEDRELTRQALESIDRLSCDIDPLSDPVSAAHDAALMQKRVGDAMWALPLWLPDDVLEDYIPALAEKYAYMRFDRLFDAKPLTEKQIRSKLLKIKKQSETLLVSVMTLEGLASDALYRTIAESDRSPEIACLIPPGMLKLHPHRPTLGEMMAYLQRLADAASSPIIPWDAVKKQKGPDLNILPREIAKAAARDFHGLTGKPPTLSKNRHEFPHFLHAVFKALDIQSGVAHHTEEAVQWWSTHPSGEPLQLVDPIVRK